MTSSIYPISFTGIAAIATVNTSPTGGSGYVTGVATVTGLNSGASDATVTIVTVVAGAPTVISFLSGGKGYFKGEILNIIQSGADGLSTSSVLTTANITVGADLLDSPIVITSDMVKPGGGGILRAYMSFEFNGNADSEIDVLNNGAFKGHLNADNDNNLESDGYYRFDLDVEEGDSLNFESDTQIDGFNFMRFHLVQFGA